VEHNIPKHLSKSFNNLKDKETKLEFLQSYYRWLDDPFTVLLFSSLEHNLNEEIRTEESESRFVSLFESKYKSAHSKGRRSVLRELLKLRQSNVR
jgi:hypothetical protein